MIATKINWIRIGTHYEWLVREFWVGTYPLYDKHVPITKHIGWFTVRLFLTEKHFSSHQKSEEQMGWDK